MTLLETYIDDTLKHYQEPERRGVEKGKEIGPFRGRFEAALYSMYDYDKKEIAELSNITYAFMRKLWVDKNFILLRNTLMDQFVIGHMFYYLHSGSLHKPGMTSDADRVLYSHNIESAFKDVDKYSVDLKNMVKEFLIVRSKDCTLGFLLTSPDRLIHLLSKWNEPELNKKIFLSELNQYTEMIEEILTQENVPKDIQMKFVGFTQFINKLSSTL
jgi:hypothetical protein